MNSLLHRLLQWLRSLLISWAASVANWAGDRIFAAWDKFEDNTPYVELLRWIDRRATDVITLAYPGSDEEERDALDAGIPAKHMSERQRAIAIEAFVNPVATCIHCNWCGFIHQAPDDTCPSCKEGSVYWDERERAHVPYTDRRALAVIPQCAAAAPHSQASALGSQPSALSHSESGSASYVTIFALGLVAMLGLAVAFALAGALGWSALWILAACVVAVGLHDAVCLELRSAALHCEVNTRRPPGYLTAWHSPTRRWLQRCAWVFLAGIMVGLTIAGYVAGLLP